MKIFRNFFFQTVVFALTVVLMQSCSCNGNADLEAKLKAVASDSTQVLMVGNFDRLFDQTGIKVDGDQVQLPEYLINTINNTLASSTRQNINFAIKDLRGIKYNNFVVAIKLPDTDKQQLAAMPSVAMVFSVSDEGDLEKSLAKIDPGVSSEKLNGYRLIGTRRFQIAVKDKLGYAVFAGGNPLTGANVVEAIEGWNKQAEEAPLSSWKKDFLCSDKVYNLIVGTGWFFENMAKVNPMYSPDFLKTQGLEAVADGFATFSANLDDQTAQLVVSMLDKDGKEVKNPYAGKFNTDMMKYASAGNVLAFSTAINHAGYEAQAKALNEVFDGMKSQAGMFSYVVPMLENIFKGLTDFTTKYMSDGGFFLTAGFADDATLVKLARPSADDFRIVLTADLLKDKAAEGYDYICNKVGEAMKTATRTSSESNGMKVTTFSTREITDYDFRTEQDVYSTFNINVALDGNILVVSNTAVAKSNECPFDKKLFENSAASAQLVINKKTPVLSMLGLPFGVDATLQTKQSTATLEVKVTDTDKHVLEAVLGFLVGSL